MPKRGEGGGGQGSSPALTKVKGYSRTFRQAEARKIREKGVNKGSTDPSPDTRNKTGPNSGKRRKKPEVANWRGTKGEESFSRKQPGCLLIGEEIRAVWKKLEAFLNHGQGTK